MPPDGGGSGEIKSDNAVHGNDKRRHDWRQHAIHDLLASRGRTIAHCRKIREKTEIPKENRGHDISEDREKIPKQGTSKLRPKSHSIGKWKQPIEQPGAAKMENWIDPRARRREQCHCFSDAVEGCAPFRPRQIEESGNERASRGDCDPPDI